MHNPERPTESDGLPQTNQNSISARLLVLPEFATIPDTRKILGIPRSTLYELESNGAIRFAQFGQGLGRSLQEQARFLVDELVGIATEARFLAPSSAGAKLTDGQSVERRLAALNLRRDQIKELAGKSGAINDLSESMAVTYFVRQKVYGEVEALRWLSKQLATDL
jgi:hypothetical protein